jgi:hypothetical protein
MRNNNPTDRHGVECALRRTRLHKEGRQSHARGQGPVEPGDAKGTPAGGRIAGRATLVQPVYPHDGIDPRHDRKDLALPDGSIDVALVNGIFNLNPARKAIFRELACVVAGGGVVCAAELILIEPLPEEQRNPSNWFA